MNDCLYCGGVVADAEARFCDACETSGRAKILRNAEDLNFAYAREMGRAWSMTMEALKIAPQQCAIMMGKWEP